MNYRWSSAWSPTLCARGRPQIDGSVPFRQPLQLAESQASYFVLSDLFAASHLLRSDCSLPVKEAVSSSSSVSPVVLSFSQPLRSYSAPPVEMDLQTVTEFPPLLRFSYREKLLSPPLPPPVFVGAEPAPIHTFAGVLPAGVLSMWAMPKIRLVGHQSSQRHISVVQLLGLAHTSFSISTEQSDVLSLLYLTDKGFSSFSVTLMSSGEHSLHGPSEGFSLGFDKAASRDCVFGFAAASWSLKMEFPPGFSRRGKTLSGKNFSNKDILKSYLFVGKKLFHLPIYLGSRLDSFQRFQEEGARHHRHSGK